jgi:hypothetical protein
MRLTVEWDREKRDSKKQNGTVYGSSVVVLLRSIYLLCERGGLAALCWSPSLLPY